MKLNKSYNCFNNHSQISKLLSKNIIAPFSPTDEDVIAFWKKISSPMPPRTFMYIISLPSDTSFRSKGMSLLGYPDQHTFLGANLLKLAHHNQRLMIAFQTTCLYNMFVNYKELIWNKGVVYCTTRGINHSTKPDTCFLTHQVAFPVQYSSTGVVSKYFCSYRIIGDYNGEAFETDIFTNSQFPEEQKTLRKIMREIKKNMLGVLEFTRMEKEVIKYISTAPLKITSKEISSLLNLSVKTIRNHKTSINQKAKEVFPLNNFKDTEDVVKHLQNQLIL